MYRKHLFEFYIYPKFLWLSLLYLQTFEISNFKHLKRQWSGYAKALRILRRKQQTDRMCIDLHGHKYEHQIWSHL